MHVWASHESPTTPNVHIRGSRRFKHHQNSTRRPPEREKKNENEGREKEKNAKFWAPHPSGQHPSGPHPSGPHSSLPHLFWVRPHPSGPHPSGPQPSGPLVHVFLVPFVTFYLVPMLFLLSRVSLFILSRMLFFLSRLCFFLSQMNLFILSRQPFAYFVPTTFFCLDPRATVPPRDGGDQGNPLLPFCPSKVSEFSGCRVKPRQPQSRRGFTRQPENSKRAPALQTPPKFHEKTPQREKKE